MMMVYDVWYQTIQYILFESNIFSEGITKQYLLLNKLISTLGYLIYEFNIWNSYFFIYDSIQLIFLLPMFYF